VCFFYLSYHVRELVDAFGPGLDAQVKKEIVLGEVEQVPRQNLLVSSTIFLVVFCLEIPLKKKVSFAICFLAQYSNGVFL
jgi:hypothetical protein